LYNFLFMWDLIQHFQIVECEDSPALYIASNPVRVEQFACVGQSFKGTAFYVNLVGNLNMAVFVLYEFSYLDLILIDLQCKRMYIRLCDFICYLEFILFEQLYIFLFEKKLYI